MASKSILRVAADVIEREFDGVLYFPSYEIITSAANGGRYYDDDLRQVTEIGVQHVMRVFKKHFLSEPEIDSPLEDRSTSSLFIGKDAGVVCDEEEIERAIRNSGI